MKRLSVKNRIALFYMGVTVLIFVMIMVGISVVGGQFLQQDQITNLKEVTQRAYDDIQITEDTLSVEQNIIYNMDGAFVVLCKEDGSIIEGDLGNAFTKEVPFRDDEVQEVEEEGEDYYLYDRKISGNGMVYWLRGMTSAEYSQMAPALVKIYETTILIIPALLLVLFLLGWLLSDRAFQPLRRITDTAEIIQKEGDLSRRIGLSSTNPKDEIQHTAKVFDNMLDQIEENFQREKQFTDDAGHELRTPVAVIMAEAEYALSAMDDPEEVEESLRSIYNQSQKMSSLIQSLLTFARADRGAQNLNKTNVDMGLLTEEICDTLSPFAEKRHIAISVDAQEEAYLECDAILMHQVVENLVTNGIKYGRDHGNLWVSLHKNKNFLRLTVRDDGIGIPKEEKESIWNRFYRGSNARAILPATDRDQSMGLGLPMAKWIVEMHGGEIRCQSTKGRGTLFVVEFRV